MGQLGDLVPVQLQIVGAVDAEPGGAQRGRREGASLGGGALDAVTGKRCIFAAFPWRWTGGDGSGVRVVAIEEAA